jgi:lipopolysaccharide transport system permease protein
MSSTRGSSWHKATGIEASFSGQTGQAFVRDSFVEIRPSRGLGKLGLSELWRYRDLAFFFVWRDVKVTYKQTIFGGAWAVIQPLILMVVFTFVLGTVLNVKTPPGVPKPLFYYAGLVPWTLFAASFGAASASLIGNATLVRKIYFPRLILPLSSMGSSFLDFLIALGFVFVMIFAYGMGLSWNVLWLPLLTLMALLTAFTIGLLISALNARYRDVRYAIPFMLQVLLFVTPLMYSSTQIPERLRPWYFLNPMAGVVEGFRWALIDAAPPPGPMTLVSAAILLPLLVVGLYYFRNAERTIADVI